MKAALSLCLAGSLAVLWGLQTATSAVMREQVLKEEVDRLTALIRRLEQETFEAMQLRSETLKQIDHLVARYDAVRRQDQEGALHRNRPMPEGVRLAVLGLQSLLAMDGYHNLRLLRAERLEQQELVGVELVEHDPVALVPTLYLAGRLGVTVDRGERCATLWLRDGTMNVAGERSPLPAEGLSIRLPSVQAELWENTLPLLVVGVGAAKTAEHLPPRLGLDEAGVWFGRVNGLLAGATLDQRFLLDRFADLEDGVFRDVLVLAYDGVRLTGSIEARRMTVRVDQEGDTVQLWFEEGVRRLRGGEARIPDQGFGLLLPGIRPGDAAQRMFGLVKTPPGR